jgi:hypothetical protein
MAAAGNEPMGPYAILAVQAVRAITQPDSFGCIESPALARGAGRLLMRATRQG